MMTIITLDGGQFSDIDNHVLGALTLSAATGRGFEMQDIGKAADRRGLSALHLTTLRALATLSNAEVEGEKPGATRLCFKPAQPTTDISDLTLDMGETLGRPSTESVTPLIEALLPILVSMKGGAFLRVLGTNATPDRPSVFWLRETLAPMLQWAGMEVAVEIERWGWYPDGGGETLISVEGSGEEQPPASTLSWKERGDLVGLWAMIALSPRIAQRTGERMRQALEKAVAEEPFHGLEIELVTVRSPGPGSGLFLALQFEHTTAGFEAVNHGGQAVENTVEEAVRAMSRYFWSDTAFEPELARAMMIPLALTGRPVSYTTSEVTLPMRVLGDLIPRFLPVSVEVSPVPGGGLIQLQPSSPTTTI